MLSLEQMKQQVEKYQLWFNEDAQRVYLLKDKGNVKLSIVRAIDWVNAGIDDLDCRSKDEMLKLLNSWK